MNRVEELRAHLTGMREKAQRATTPWTTDAAYERTERAEGHNFAAAFPPVLLLRIIDADLALLDEHTPTWLNGACAICNEHEAQWPCVALLARADAWLGEATP